VKFPLGVGLFGMPTEMAADIKHRSPSIT